VLFAVETCGWELTITAQNSVDNLTSLAIDLTATTNFQEHVCCLCIQVLTVRLSFLNSSYRVLLQLYRWAQVTFSLTWCQLWDETVADNSSLRWVRCLDMHVLPVLLVRYQELKSCITASLWLLKCYGEDVGVVLLKLEGGYESWLTAWWSQNSVLSIESKCCVLWLENDFWSWRLRGSSREGRESDSWFLYSCHSCSSGSHR